MSTLLYIFHAHQFILWVGSSMLRLILIEVIASSKCPLGSNFWGQKAQNQILFFLPCFHVGSQAILDFALSALKREKTHFHVRPLV